MTHGCTVAQRDRVRRAADVLGALPCVLGVDVLAPDVEPLRAWALEVTIDDRVAPPEVTREVAIEGLAIESVAPRGVAVVLVARANWWRPGGND